jgi:hypothetical protein
MPDRDLPETPLQRPCCLRRGRRGNIPAMPLLLASPLLAFGTGIGIVGLIVIIVVVIVLLRVL